MAAERTEEPTPKRLEEARRRGEVAVSRDATSAAAMTAAIVALVLQGPALTARLLAYWKATFAGAAAAGGAMSGGSSGVSFDASFGASSALVAGVGVLARALAVPLAAAALVALGAGLLQTRGLLALGALRPDLARLSPASGLSRTFGGKAALEIGKGLLKAMLVASLAWLTVRQVLAGLAG